jgi:hypothetical protein
LLTQRYIAQTILDEDRSQVRSGNIPQVMAAVRNLVLQPHFTG